MSYGADGRHGMGNSLLLRFPTWNWKLTFKAAIKRFFPAALTFFPIFLPAIRSLLHNMALVMATLRIRIRMPLNGFSPASALAPAPAPLAVCFLCWQFYFGQCFGTKAINSICTHRARGTNSQKMAKNGGRRSGNDRTGEYPEPRGRPSPGNPPSCVPSAS